MVVGITLGLVGANGAVVAALVARYRRERRWAATVAAVGPAPTWRGADDDRMAVSGSRDGADSPGRAWPST